MLPTNETKNDSHSENGGSTNFDFSHIPSGDEFQKIKIKRENRWFNSAMALLVITIGSCIGVIIGVLVNHFA